jgi:hypothetical protein
MPDEKPPRFRTDGTPDGRGQSDGSKAHRFAKGDGRPRPGRRRGSRDERTIVQTLRNLTVTATIGNKQVKLNTYEAILHKQRQLALGGNLAAAKFVMEWIARFEPPSVEPNHTAAVMEEDAIILADARRRGVLGTEEGHAS